MTPGTTSAHLLPVTVEQLDRLPDGVAVVAGIAVYRLHRPPSMIRVLVAAHGTSRIDRQDLALVMDDTLTAAAVAARIVRPWLMERGSRSGREFGDAEALAEHHGSLSAALLMQPLTPDQRDELTRLARAAMEGA